MRPSSRSSAGRLGDDPISGKLFLWTVALSVAGILAGLWIALGTVRREVRLGRVKTDFVSSVSHELKTPLTSIRMFIETLRAGRYSGPDERDRYLDLMAFESDRLARLIGRVLEFSKIEEGTKVYRFEEVDLAALLSRVVAASIAPHAADPPAIRLAVEEPCPPIVADPLALEEILWNLLDNARKYSPERASIDVTARAGSDPQEIWIAVRDRGLGIPERFHRKIFDKFFRVAEERTRSIEGTGLGLAIVRHLAAAHGGRVEVESAPGRGSTFTVILPLRPPGRDVE